MADDLRDDLTDWLRLFVVRLGDRRRARMQAISQAGMVVTMTLMISGVVLLAQLARYLLSDFLFSVGRPFLAGGVMLLIFQ